MQNAGKTFARMGKKPLVTTLLIFISVLSVIFAVIWVVCCKINSKFLSQLFSCKSIHPMNQIGKLLKTELKIKDPEVYSILSSEIKRQTVSINLIASEVFYKLNERISLRNP